MLRCIFVMAVALAAVPAQASDTGPFRIHFDQGVFELSERNKQLLDSMKLMARDDGFIRLSGHTGTAGSPEGNLRLARRRVDGARSFLLSIGMPRGRILTEVWARAGRSPRWTTAPPRRSIVTSWSSSCPRPRPGRAALGGPKEVAGTPERSSRSALL